MVERIILIIQYERDGIKVRFFQGFFKKEYTIPWVDVILNILVMILLLAWKPRSAKMTLAISSPSWTFEVSVLPWTTVPDGPVPGTFRLAGPESAVMSQSFWPMRVRPLGLANVAS